MKIKTAFITGITGMVGSHLLDFLIKNTNWKIYGLIRWRSPLKNIQSHLEKLNYNNSRLKLIYGDIRDSNCLNDIIKNLKPDYCFHLAAQSYPLTSFTSPVDTYETNILGTEKLLSSFKNYSKETIIHVCSSSEVFGRVSRDKLPINEDCTFHPASPYAISKIGTDQIAQFYSEAYNMKILTTRMFTHTGPRRGDVFAESSFAKQIAMIENKNMKKQIYVGNLNSLRTWADVRDAVRAYYILVTTKPKYGEVYNIGGTFSCTVKEMLYTLLKLSKVKNIKVIKDKKRMRPIDADLQLPDISKFQNHTNWKPKISFEKTMSDLLNYWRQEIKNRDDIISNR